MPSHPSDASPPDHQGARFLDVPPERRAAAKAHAALLAQTADRIARELPFVADVDDFRRVLVEEAMP